MSRVRVMLLVLLISGSFHVIPGEEVSEEEDDDDAVTLTKDICLEARTLEPESFLLKHCCGFHYDHDPKTVDCMKEIKVSPDHSPMTDFAKRAECIYIKKKFTKGTENLNFSRIKAAARKLHDPRERKYMVVMYETCSREAKQQLNALKAETKPGELILGLRRPFYTLVFICAMSYPVKTSCPYFKWDESEVNCVEYAGKCRQLLQKSKQ